MEVIWINTFFKSSNEIWICILSALVIVLGKYFETNSQICAKCFKLNRPWPRIRLKVSMATIVFKIEWAIPWKKIIFFALKSFNLFQHDMLVPLLIQYVTCSYSFGPQIIHHHTTTKIATNPLLNWAFSRKLLMFLKDDLKTIVYFKSRIFCDLKKIKVKTHQRVESGHKWKYYFIKIINVITQTMSESMPSTQL